MDLTYSSAQRLADAPWPATLEELLDYAERSGAPLLVIEYLKERMWEEGETEEYDSLTELWPPYEEMDGYMEMEGDY